MDSWAARAHANGLGTDTDNTVVGAVGRVVGVQGQDVRATRLAVRARTTGLTAQDVDDAVTSGEVIRTWAMRGTLHLIAAADFRWVVSTFGPYFRDRQRPRRRQLGLDDAACEQATAQLEAVLTEPLTRAEIVERLDLDLAGQAAPHLLAFAAFEGVICRGPERGNDATYVLARDWVTAPQRDSDLGQRYVDGYGSADPADLAAWSGLPLTTARKVIRDVAPPKHTESTRTRLLGHFDTFLLGYRERAVPAIHAKVIQSGGGFVMPAIVAGGRVVGSWRLAGDGRIEVMAFTTISARLRQQLTAEAADLGRFLHRETRLCVSDPAEPD